MNKVTKTMLLMFKTLVVALIAFTTFSCSNVETNHEGILMTNYGRNGRSDFEVVTGRQSTIMPGTKLYNIPMYEQNADPSSVIITSKDGGKFAVDPTYTYQAIRGKGLDILFNYKHLQGGEDGAFLDKVEVASLNNLVINSYREQARNFKNDSINKNLAQLEQAVEQDLKAKFEQKGFTLHTLTSGLTPPQSMTEAIDRRNNAKILAETKAEELKATYAELEKSKVEKEINLVRSAGLTPELLQEKYIDAIKETDNMIIITDGKTPVLLNGLNRQ